MSSSLDTALLNAHAQDDRHGLIRLYQTAAECAEDDDASGFFLTHAYVYALECGDPLAEGLRAQLIKMGRERAD